LSICHIISGLGTGGAERMLERLLSLAPENQVVISLSVAGPQAEAIKRLGVSVYALGLKLSPDLPLRLLAFARLLRQIKPDVVVGWMYHGNLAASFGGVVCNAPVVWNVRHSVHDLSHEKFGLRAVIHAGSWISFHPREIVYNSEVAAEQHQRLGYKADRSSVLPNGFETQQYVPDPVARAEVRAELELTSDAFLVGHVARYHPMKDHKGFLNAAARLVKTVSAAQFLMIGFGVTEENTELVDEIERLGLSGRVHLLGERQDIPRLMAAFDVQVSSSVWGEGFPNVVGEAMACGVPAVVTDIGDSSRLVGNVGRVVPPGDTAALCDALEGLYAMGAEARAQLGVAARKRAVDEFDLLKISGKYYALWAACVT